MMNKGNSSPGGMSARTAFREEGSDSMIPCHSTSPAIGKDDPHDPEEWKILRPMAFDLICGGHDRRIAL
jgi:hypothetical protein